jgi:hypothetical protein
MYLKMERNPQGGWVSLIALTFSFWIAAMPRFEFK